MIVQDGKAYANSSDVPDLGSIRCVGSEGNRRSYILKESDVSKLSNINYVADGSTARVVDGEHDFYTFLCGEWFKS